MRVLCVQRQDALSSLPLEFSKKCLPAAAANYGAHQKIKIIGRQSDLHNGLV